jgi:hypothetical protein
MQSHTPGCLLRGQSQALAESCGVEGHVELSFERRPVALMLQILHLGAADTCFAVDFSRIGACGGGGGMRIAART